MQPTNRRRPDSGRPAHEADTTTNDTVEQWATVGWQALRVSALVLWIVVGSYAWFRSMQPASYTVGVVGATFGVALAAELFGWNPTPRQLTESRLVVAGCLLGLVAGTVTIALAVEQVGASQPTVSTLAVGGGLLLCGSLLVAAARQSVALAGLAGGVVAASWASAPDVRLVETVVFGTTGIYGPLTQAAVSWIAPACLLVGCWRAAGTERQLSALWNATAKAWPTNRQEPGLGRLVAGVGCAVVLVGWQTATLDSPVVVGFAAIPIGLLGVVSVRAALQPSATAEHRVEWAAPTLMLSGPLVVMLLVGGGYQLPVGTTLVAGCLCCLGLCLIRPYVLSGDHASNTPASGVETVLDGSVIGCQLLCWVLVPVAVIGGSLSLLGATGHTTWFVAGVVWLSGGYPVAVVLVVAGCCVALGALLSVVGGYTAGALVGVPLLQLLGPVGALTAHLVVLTSVVVGWLLAWRVRTTVTISTPLDT